MNALPFLSDVEVDAICDPLKRPAAQRKYLAEVLKLSVHQKPNGRALVARSEFERVIGAARFSGQPSNTPLNAPNVVGMMAHLAQRKHGTKTQGR